MIRYSGLFVSLVGCVALAGCGVPEPAGSTGGLGDGGAFLDGSAAGEACGRGFVVVEQADDFRSTNVALVGLDGQTLSESFASSATTDVGISPPLIGDIVTPTMRATGDRIVLLDRSPASVLLWYDVATGGQTARLDVSTGFVSNPHDYVEVSPNKAYVTRFESNLAPGAEPHDAGGDLLIVDPSVPEITGPISFASVMEGEDADMWPRPDRVVQVGQRVYVLLEPISSDYLRASSARIVAIDVGTDEIVDALVLDGLQECAGLSLSPDGTRVAVGCMPTRGTDISTSGIAIVDLEPSLSERARFEAADLGGRPIGFYVEFSGPETVLATSRSVEESGEDRLVEVDLNTGAIRTIVSRPDFWVVHEVRCASGCGVCVAADSGVPGGVLHVLDVEEDGRVASSRELVVERRYAMPPRYVGRF